MTLYIVIRYGVYMQGVVGVYSTQARAEDAMKKAKALEPDNYHDFEIKETEIDVDLYYSCAHQPGGWI